MHIEKQKKQVKIYKQKRKIMKRNVEKEYKYFIFQMDENLIFIIYHRTAVNEGIGGFPYILNLIKLFNKHLFANTALFFLCLSTHKNGNIEKVLGF